MFRKRSQKTLKEEVERWLPDEKAPHKTKKIRKILKIFIFLLLFLVVWQVGGYILYIEGFILSILLFQKYLTEKRYKTGKRSKQNIKDAKKVRMLPWALLTFYFAILSIALTGYGVMYFVLHLPMEQYDMKDWFMDGLAVFLFFEIIALELNLIFEREV